MRVRTRALRTDASATTNATTPKPIWPAATIRAPAEVGARAPGSIVVNVAIERYAAPARSSGSVNALTFCCATDQYAYANSAAARLTRPMTTTRPRIFARNVLNPSQDACTIAAPTKESTRRSNNTPMGLREGDDTMRTSQGKAKATVTGNSKPPLRTPKSKERRSESLHSGSKSHHVV